MCIRDSDNINDFIEEKRALIEKEKLLLQLKLVESYSKLPQETILLMKSQQIEESSKLFIVKKQPVLQQQQSLLSSLLSSTDAGEELVRKSTTEWFDDDNMNNNNHSNDDNSTRGPINYTEKPSLASSLSYSYCLSSSQDTSSSESSSYSLSEIKSLTDRLYKEENGLRYRYKQEHGLRFRTKTIREHDIDNDLNSDHSNNLLEKLVDIEDPDTDLLWSFEI